MYLIQWKMILWLLFRLKDENRRLLQEKAENEQVIKLLETQKEVLSKSVRDSRAYVDLLNSLDTIDEEPWLV